VSKKASNHDIETKLIHCGHEPDLSTGALASPIYQTATFAAKSVGHFNQLCDDFGYIYSRESNPTLTELELKLAMLEGGECALVTTSGMGAITTTFLTLLKTGDHVISCEGIFAQTEIFFRELLGKFGVEITFIDLNDLDEVKSNIKKNTKIIYGESPLNPSLRLIDIQKLAEITQQNEILLIIDGTFAPPPMQHALKFGADLCVHSLTKYMNGHGDALGGGVIGGKKLIDKIRWPALACFTGASLPPLNAWLIIRGIKTLHMRVNRHCETALTVAKFLNEHPYVEIVNYPALKDHPQYELCQTQMNGMGGGVISFKFNDGIKNLERKVSSTRFLNSLKLCTIAVSLGEEHTLTYLEGDLIRIAIGWESPKDIIHDLEQAMDCV
jgi:methionine-gamma-lyase